MKYIAVDIGSSFLKSALFDIEVCTIFEHNKYSTPAKLQNADKNNYEISTSQLLDTVKEIIDGYTKVYSDIRGVLFSTQMHGFIYSVNGREDKYISWQDTRCMNTMNSSGESYMEHLRNLFSKNEMTRCGTYIKPSLGLCNLYALLNGSEHVDKNGELFTLGSYIIAKLTGNNICHITNAAPLGLADITAYVWDGSVIGKAGLDGLTLPKIARSDFEICGTFVSNGQKLNVYADFGDQQAAILGSMADKNDIVINIGTACQISCTMDTFIPGNYETRPYFEGHYINTISNMPGGRNLDVLINFLKDSLVHITGYQVETGDVWKAVLDKFKFDARNLQVDMGFYTTPDNVNGGGINRITPNNFDLNSLFSAAFINMAKTYDKNIKTLCNSGKNIERIVCSGGVSWKTPQLLETIGLVTGYPYALSAIQDEVFSGLYRIALVCEGISRSLDETREMKLVAC